MLYFRGNIQARYLPTIFMILTLIGEKGVSSSDSSAILQVDIKVGVVCDQEFSELFHYNETRIQQIVINEIRGMEINFQTLRLTKFSFILTSILVIKNITEQPFIENSRIGDGSTDTNIVVEKFESWINGSEIGNISNVLLLITGSAGQNHCASKIANLCPNDNVPNNKHNVIVLRSEKSKFHTTRHLTTHMAQIFGTSREITSCLAGALLMSIHDCRSPSVFYFSSDSDVEIRKYFLTKDASCLKSGDAGKFNLSNFAVNPLTITEQCAMAFSNYTDVIYKSTLLVNECTQVTCTRAYVELGQRVPFHGTQCGNDKVCFRGRCIETGSVIKNAGNGHYLLATYSYHNTIKLHLQPASSYVARFDKVEMVVYGNALLIKAPNNQYTSRDTLQCLTVDAEQKNLVFEVCPFPTTTSFFWDKISVNATSSYFFLCNRKLRKCIYSNANGSIKLESLPHAENNDYQLWSLDQETDLEYIMNIEDAMMFYKQQTLEIKIALACDYACGDIFEYQESKVLRYWQNLLRDAQTKLRTSTNPAIMLVITSTTFFWLNSTSSISTENYDFLLNGTFLDWMLQEKGTLPKFNVAIHTTANSPNGTFEAHFIEEYQKTGILGIITHSPDLLYLGRCEDLVDTISLLYADAIAVNGYYDEAQECMITVLVFKQYPDVCGLDRFYLLSCQEYFFLRYATLKELSVEVENNVTALSVLDIGDNSVLSLSLESQCDLGQLKNPVVKKENDTCDIAVCQYPPNYQHLILPLYKTPCGTDQFCFRGRCISQGRQIQHGTTTKCLSGANAGISNDFLDLVTCKKNPIPIYSFIVRQITNTTVLLVTPYTNPEREENSDKCLTVQTGFIRYGICPETSREVPKFLWHIVYTDRKRKFLLKNKALGKCVIVKENMTRPQMGKCDAKDEQAQWAFIPMDSEPNFTSHMNSDSVGGSTMMYVYIAVGCIALIICCGLMFTHIVRRLRLRNLQMIDNAGLFSTANFFIGALDQLNPEINVGLQTDALPYDKKLWEIPFENLKFGKKLGAGAFGNVYEADAVNLLDREATTKVAVKVSQASSDPGSIKALVSELKVMANVGMHLNILKLLGACVESFSVTCQLCVVLEYCKNGCLLDYLHKNESKFVNLAMSESEYTNGFAFTGKTGSLVGKFSTFNLVSWAYQIARGMEYLTSRRILHGDLAARNVLLTEDLVAKISDFGFSKHLTKTHDYNYKKALQTGLFPYKWMALESILKGVFSSQSDCWSYGVTLWKMFTLGEKPYSGMQVDQTFVDTIKNGYRMDKPCFATLPIYQMMLQCWQANPELRPTFADIAKSFLEMLGPAYERYYEQLELNFEETYKEKASTTADFLMPGRRSVANNYQNLEINIYNNMN